MNSLGPKGSYLVLRIRSRTLLLDFSAPQGPRLESNLESNLESILNPY